MEKEKSLSGFVKLLWQLLSPLNNNPKFKQKFKDQQLNILINVIDGEHAAIVKIDKGVVDVESVKNGNKKYMKDVYKKYNCNGFLETKLALIFAIAQGNLSTVGMAKEILKRNMRVKGIRKLRLFEEILNFNLKSLRVTNNTMIKDIVKSWAQYYGEKTFLTYIVDFNKGIDEKYSFKEIHSISNQYANGLLDLGIGKGDGIALMDINSPEFLLTILAAMKLGAYIVLVNTGLKGEGLKYILEHSDASSIVVHWSFLDTFLEIRDQVPKVKQIIVDLRDAPNDFKVPDGIEQISSFMHAPDIDIDIEISLEDICMLMYTAGTTGLPKAITFWQGKLLGGMNVRTLMKIVAILVEPNDIIFTPLPLFHSNALFLSTFAAFISGAELILGKRFSASRHWDICRKYGVTVFNTLGAMVTFLMKQPEQPNDRDHKVRAVNTAACPKELWESFEDRFGVRVQEAYGATDGGGFMLITQIFDDVPVGTMGKPIPGVIAEIMDENGNILLEPEQIGELVFLLRRSEAKTREVKYFKDEEGSRALVSFGADGQKWFHTGDLAYKDAGGWFYFKDRKKDSIRRRGENIASVSIENIIAQNEKILEVAAYGVKTDIGEDEVMISVVLKKDQSIDPKEIIEFCKDKMADFMIPRYINIVDELPKNEVHRVLKRKLKQIGITKTTWDREQN